MLDAYGLVEVQGPPAYGVRQFGVPVGGWFDRDSAMTANLLAGRDRFSSCLELTMAHIRFVVSAPFAFSVCGAASEVWIEGALAGFGGLFWAQPGSEVRISSPRAGARSYVSALFTDLPNLSTRLLVGAALAYEATLKSRPSLRLLEPEWLAESGGGPLSAASATCRLRVVPGPQAHLFDYVARQAASQGLGGTADTGLPPQSSAIFDGESRRFTVSPKSNRVGIRLEEAIFPHKIELPSEPAGLGAIQVTPDGTLIILGPDGPTIGGYPKIAYVISADFDRLGQVRPGESVSFEVISLDDARRIGIERSRRSQRRHTELKLARMRQ